MKEIITTPAAPTPGGPYSQAVRVGGFVYTAGQVGNNPATGKVESDTIGGQTEQVLANLGAILEAAGSSLENVVKTTVFLSDLANFSGMNEVYSRVFAQERPARSTVGVSLPPGILVEIEAVALISRA